MEIDQSIQLAHTHDLTLPQPPLCLSSTHELHFGEGHSALSLEEVGTRALNIVEEERVEGEKSFPEPEEKEVPERDRMEISESIKRKKQETDEEHKEICELLRKAPYLSPVRRGEDLMTMLKVYK